jgi:uncharacterized damage-inducible protein DinB
MDLAQVVKHWKGVRRDLLRALDALADEELAFVPRDGLWSLGKVARHIAEAEEGWFRYAVTSELEEWPEFRDDDHASIASVKALLTEVHDRTEAFLGTLGHDDPVNADTSSAGTETVIETSWGEKLALDWIILHVLEHEIHHRGEIYLMLGLLGLGASDI